MCGIVAARTPDPAAPYLLHALRMLEYRGYDSAGVSVRTRTNALATIRTIGRVEALAVDLDSWGGADLDGLGIGHTRWATHGGVTEGNAHPHVDCAGRVAVAHNGIIENADELRAELTARGHLFASDVDSEVVSHLVEEALLVSGDLLTATVETVARLRGSWGLVIVDSHSGRLVAAADRSPLVVASSARGDFVSSDPSALAEWTDSFRPLRDGDVVEIGTGASRWTSRGLPVAEPDAIPTRWRPAELSRGDHPDFMGKEIAEQPLVAARIIERLQPSIGDGSLWRGLGLPDFDRVAVLACGTSLHAGRIIGEAFGRLGGVPHTSVVASEVRGSIAEPRTLVLGISQSGETADILRALSDSEPTGSLLALTNNPHSALARRADAVLDCSAGPEVGVAATKTFVAQVVTGVALAISALVATGRIDERRGVLLADELGRIPDLLASAIAVSKAVIPAVVEEIRDAQGFLFLGRGAGVVYAAEGALKLKELSYRWAEHYPAGELKHGPLALVDVGTPVIVVDDGDPRLAANIAEVRARGGRVITIGHVGADIPALGRSIVPPLLRDGRPDGCALWGPLEAVVPLQILARDLALALGRDVDKPRNLAKSVTVE